MRRLAPLLVLALLGPGRPLAAWGREGHHIVADLALRDLPPAPAAWFKGRESDVTAHSSDPDEWKRDRDEGPRHFLDMDAYEGRVPTLISEARARLGPAAFRKAGQVPWVIQEATRLLADAFRKGDPEQVALRASWLSHYVGDLHVPLHTVRDYDGQETGQRGVHSRWETGLVAHRVREPEVRPAELEPDLLMAPWRWLEATHALVPALLEDDRRSGPGSRKGSEYWESFNRRQGPVVREQLARAAQHTAQLILLAWDMAGRPAAPK